MKEESVSEKKILKKKLLEKMPENNFFPKKYSKKIKVVWYALWIEKKS